jgi:hypothetical protein
MLDILRGKIIPRGSQSVLTQPFPMIIHQGHHIRPFHVLLPTMSPECIVNTVLFVYVETPHLRVVYV